jgi:ribosomal protein L11 methyltransferase
LSTDRSPALIIRFPPTFTAAARDRLVGVLAEHDLVAIQEDDPATPRTWTAHFSTAVMRDAAAMAVTGLGELAPDDVATAEIEDEDWARLTQAELPAIRVGRVIVAPPWDRPAASSTTGTHSPGDLVVEIEPSRGFGTGHHQSTRLCLVLLQNRELANRTVTDVGTGSGVLAIVAAKLGAAYVTAIDVDPDAIDNARENIERNGVAHVVEAHVRDLDESATPPADLVIANLTGALLARYASRLLPLVRPSGNLIVAGFTIDERDLVRDAFSGAFDVTETAEEDDWWAFELARHAAPQDPRS